MICLPIGFAGLFYELFVKDSESESYSEGKSESEIESESESGK